MPQKKSSRKDAAMLLLLGLSVALIVWGNTQGFWMAPSLRSESEKVRSGEPLCFMFGDVMRGGRTQGLQSLSNVIRLRFAADEASDCSSQMEYYCRREFLEKDHTVGKLSGFFEGPRGREDFEVSSQCIARRVSSGD